jgi:NADH-quinone oxidoreductase subunit E
VKKEEPQALCQTEAFQRLESEYAAHIGEKGALIPLLQQTQATFGYIPVDAIEAMARITGVPESEIYGVVTFYKQFRLKPLGKYLVRLCDGTACHVNDSMALHDILTAELKLSGEADTSPDGLFTLILVACLGCCSLAPVIMVNDETFGRLTPQKVRQIIRQFRSREKSADAASGGK